MARSGQRLYGGGTVKSTEYYHVTGYVGSFFFAYSRVRKLATSAAFRPNQVRKQ